MNFSCPYCGGSRLQHLRTCPKIYTITSQLNKRAKKDFFGESPNLFVGRWGYPNVNVGFLSNEDLPKDADQPKLWSYKSYEIPQIVDLRASLINSRFKANVKSFDEKFIEITKEVAMARRPVDVEVHLNKEPKFRLQQFDDVTPYGPTVQLEKAQITENPKISTHVERAVDDDIKAVEGMNYLYGRGYDEHFLTKLLSAGTLGKKKRMVPTRWSITATDDTLGKELIGHIKDFKEHDYCAHFGGYLGNYYLILFFPRVWSYELFETYVGKGETETASDYELYSGRKDYASNTVGGYYAARLGILEYLKKKNRQSSVLALRFITDEYYMALGVWVVREATRKSLKSNPIHFSSEELMMRYASLLTRKKFGFDIENLLQKSMLMKMLRQKKITEF